MSFFSYTLGEGYACAIWICLVYLQLVGTIPLRAMWLPTWPFSLRASFNLLLFILWNHSERSHP